MSVIENITVAPIAVKKIPKSEAYEIARSFKKNRHTEKENAYSRELPVVSSKG